MLGFERVERLKLFTHRCSDVLVESFGVVVLYANSCRTTWCLFVFRSPGREVLLGFDLSTRSSYHDEINITKL